MESRRYRNMPNRIRSFAITADDVSRALRFYEAVFGWRFEPWGQPEFYLILTGDGKEPGIQGLLHKRRQAVTGTGMTGFECTVNVLDIDATIAAVENSGGKIVMEKFNIPKVGTGIYFNDTEGNLVGAMQYEKTLLA
jgi:predicted enzyme related to lactoylglutathione lyase